MKKTLSVMCLCTLLLCVLFLCTSCASKAATPTKLTLDGDTLTLEWKRVAGARAYEVRISGEERTKTTQANYFSLEYLAAGEYVVEVRSISADPESDPSDWVSFNFVREAESGLRYRLINNKTEYEVAGAGSASGDVVMESVYRGKPVTAIADKAFNNNKKITSIVIGENVKTIGNNAFNRCAELKSVTIPESVVSIGEYAFQSCKMLTSIKLPSKLTAISPYMFSWCSSLTEVIMGDQIESIGEYAFSNCVGLTTMTLPGSITSIGDYAFSDCTMLTSMDLGNGMQTLGEYAFSNCVALTNLDLGESLISTGRASFAGCTALESVVVPESTITIEQETFANCTALTEVSLGTKLERIGMYAFYNTAVSNAAENVFYLDGWAVENKNKDRKSLVLQEGTYGIADGAFANCHSLESFRTTGVKYVGISAFYGCDKMFEAIFDDALLKINDSAFSKCTILANVKVGNSLVSLGKYAFRDCTVLMTMDLPDTLTTIGAYCFNNTNAFNQARSVVYMDNWVVGLKNDIYLEPVIIREGIRGIADYSFNKALIFAAIELPSTLEIIGRGAFYNNAHTRLFNLPEGLRYIGDYAFYGSQQAWFGENGETRIPDTVEYIGRSAFYNCGFMVSLHISSGVRTIGDYAFYKCTGLGDSGMVFMTEEDYKNGNAMKGTVTIAEGVVSIGERAFQNCIGLIELDIPDSVQTIGSRAFYGCSRLKTVSLGENLEAVADYTFYKCEALADLYISDSVQYIGDYAFRGCVALKGIRLGQSVERVGKSAFLGCTEVKEIILPTSLKYIDDYAFRGCAKVDSVIVPSSVQYVGKHVFYGLNKSTLFCEAEALPALWNLRWNSSYRTVFWGCTLSEDDSYVVSFTKRADRIDNVNAPDASQMPERDGYVFEGWSVSADATTVDYTNLTMSEAPDGTVLYAVWKQESNSN